ncbi:hypothetical protein J610_2823 [Acinetobacter sp. 723929]|uniref:hypothetical protein n=1 Tax=Acinetobacter sp. 723929 TaxID=1310711 RepID=UPI00044AA88D|nr:hypothetical protein [Acinetobacter sp. 723929]EXI15744.1 hypothetical protein J610_2823 [Acinetobacter sp. 723929]
MTDLNKEREAFETWFTTTDVYKRISHQIQMCGSGRHQDIFTVFQRDDWREENYAQVSVMASWLAWQEKAKAQAVPEGYVLMPKVPSEKMFQAYERYSVAPMSTLSKTGYKAMVEAAGDQNENS